MCLEFQRLTARAAHPNLCGGLGLVGLLPRVRVICTELLTWPSSLLNVAASAGRCEDVDGVRFLPARLWASL